MTTNTTSWTLVQNGDSETVTLPDGVINSASIRFEGSETTTTETKSKEDWNSKEGYNSSCHIEGTFPTVPSEGTFSHHEYEYEDVLYANEDNHDGYIDYVFLGDESLNWREEPIVVDEDDTYYSHHTYTESTNLTGTNARLEVEWGVMEHYSYIYWLLRTYYDVTTTNVSENVSVDVNGTTVSGPSSLSGGSQSSWYDITAEAQNGDNTLNFSVSGSGEVKYQVEYDVTTAPSTPQNLSSSVSADDISLNWDSVDWDGDQGHYNILRGTSSGSYSEVATVSAGTTTYTDSGLLDGEKYFYVVTAENSAGTSSQSNETSKTTALPAPSGVSANEV